MQLNPASSVSGQSGDIPNRVMTANGVTVNNMGVNLGRQVYDKSYYINKLKEKQQAIIDETDKLRKRT